MGIAVLMMGNNPGSAGTLEPVRRVSSWHAECMSWPSMSRIFVIPG
jgi:hypothetical protein